MLGVELSHIKSLAVGYLRTLNMYPLSFSEFCISQNVPDSITEQVRESYEKKIPLDDSIHDRLTRLFRIYLVVGGMPEAVQKHIEMRGDVAEVRIEHRQLVNLYREDIAKYAGRRALSGEGDI